MSDVGPTDVQEYKRLLQSICDNRPSGTRGRLAVALNTNRSFVSQLSNPNYSMPIPAQHLETIFEVCRFSPSERGAFLESYDRAHPGRRGGTADDRSTRLVSLRVPDLGDPERNRALDELLAEHVRHLVKFVTAARRERADVEGERE